MAGAVSKQAHPQVARPGGQGCHQTQQRAGDRGISFILRGWRRIKAGGEGQNTSARSAAPSGRGGVFWWLACARQEYTACTRVFTWASLFICSVYLPVCLSSCKTQCMSAWLFDVRLSLCPPPRGGPALLWAVTPTHVPPSVPVQTAPASLRGLSSRGRGSLRRPGASN